MTRNWSIAVILIGLLLPPAGMFVQLAYTPPGLYAQVWRQEENWMAAPTRWSSYEQVFPHPAGVPAKSRPGWAWPPPETFKSSYVADWFGPLSPQLARLGADGIQPHERAHAWLAMLNYAPIAAGIAVWLLRPKRPEADSPEVEDAHADSD